MTTSVLGRGLMKPKTSKDERIVELKQLICCAVGWPNQDCTSADA